MAQIRALIRCLQIVTLQIEREKHDALFIDSSPGKNTMNAARIHSIKAGSHSRLNRKARANQQVGTVVCGSALCIAKSECDGGDRGCGGGRRRQGRGGGCRARLSRRGGGGRGGGEGGHLGFCALTVGGECDRAHGAAR
jgi:hypothetical protein